VSVNLDFEGRHVLSIPEAAGVLGLSVSSTYTAARRGDFPVRRIGRRFVVPARPFFDWLNGDSMKRPTETGTPPW
jgi:hypothetical protein